MNPEQFQRYAETNQVLADYLDEIAQQGHGDGEHDRATGLELLFVVASYAAYQWVRRYIDRRRGLDQAELRQLMAADIERFVAMGYSREEALAAVIAVSEAVAVAPPSDDVLTTAVQALES
jgi:hypothetical protein